MNQKNMQKIVFIFQIVCAVIFIGLSAVLVLNRDSLTLSPWDTDRVLELATYTGGNGDRIVIIENGQKSVTVLNSQREVLYRLDAKLNTPGSFSVAMFAEIDEGNNLYVLDTDFGGAHENNTERVLMYSEKGEFIREIYADRYLNDEFIITKGKISGMAYFDNAVYLVRLENEGFYLERVSTVNQNEPKQASFFEYPNAFRDLAFSHINVKTEKITITKKAGGIKQYDFSGNLVSEWEITEGSLPWMAVSDDNNNIIHTDIFNNTVVFIDTASGERTVLFTKAEGSPYYYINYTKEILFATAEDLLFISASTGEEALDTYSFSPDSVKIRYALFVFGILDVFAFLVLFISFILFLLKKQFSETFKLILFSGICIAFGAGIASILIINEMTDRYYESTYNDLENISRLIAKAVDIDVLVSISSSAEFENDEYHRAADAIKAQFSELQFNGKAVYQYIWMERDGVVYSMYDSESALGTFFPFEDYEGSTQQEVYDSKQYVYTIDVTSAGRWLFANGPIFDENGNVAAVIETGYDMRSVQEQTRAMIIQTTLIVIAASIAFLLLMIEFILISNVYKTNKSEWRVDKPLPFRPELPRLFIFIMYIAGNLPTALLPMYAANLYQPVFNLPREVVITLPFTIDVIFVSLALLIVPNLLKKLGLKQISLMAAFLYVIGNVLCFIAPNTLYLAFAYAFTGFSGGAIILVINTIIGAQKNIKDVNSGFAHFNASYLAGMNIGVVFGSILAQFFPYRTVYLFALIVSVVLLVTFIISIRSKYFRYIYDITKEELVAIDYQKEAYLRDQKSKKFALLKFIFSPMVLGALFLLLLPYQVSSSFTSYFMPVFGTENGLGESNIGQLILLSGLFAILFGTALCEYAGKKFSIKVIIAISLLLNSGGIYLFSLNVSIPMLIAVIIVLAIANIFALTNIQTYFTTLYQGTHVSSMKALSIYSAVENLSMMFGPILFSYILANDIAEGMKLFAYASLGCLALFLLLSLFFGKKKKSLQSA
jgi:predicted MFS family arabinose efflux permease